MGNKGKLMENLTQAEVKEVKKILSDRKKNKGRAKPGLAPSRKVLLVRGDRVAGAANVPNRKKYDLPEGCREIPFDPMAKIGWRVVGNKARPPSGKRSFAVYKNKAGNDVRIIVDPDDMPKIKGLKLEKTNGA